MDSRKSTRIKRKNLRYVPEDDDTTVSHATIRASELSDDPIEDSSDSEDELCAFANDTMSGKGKRGNAGKGNTVEKKTTENTPTQVSQETPAKSTTSNHENPTSSVKKSRFAKRNLAAEFSSNKKQKGAKPTFTIVRIKPDGKEGHGFCIFTDSYTDYIMSQPFFDRNVPKNKQFLETIACVPFCMKAKDPNGGFRKRTPKNPTEEKKYNLRNIVVLCDQDTTNGDIVEFMNETFIPAILQVSGILPSQVAEVSDKTMEVYDCWDDILDQEDLHRVFRFMVRCHEPKVEAETFLKKDVENVYAFYKESEVPQDFIQDHNLAPVHLKQGDAHKGVVPDDEFEDNE